MNHSTRPNLNFDVCPKGRYITSPNPLTQSELAGPGDTIGQLSQVLFYQLPLPETVTGLLGLQVKKLLFLVDIARRTLPDLASPWCHPARPGPVTQISRPSICSDQVRSTNSVKIWTQDSVQLGVAISFSLKFQTPPGVYGNKTQISLSVCLCRRFEYPCLLVQHSAQYYHSWPTLGSMLQVAIL